MHDTVCFSFEDQKISGGPIVNYNSTVLLLYKLALSETDLRNGQLLESTYSPDIPISVMVNEGTLLKGIYRGIIGMHGGGSIRMMVIPSEMGYGTRGYGPIPPNATLFAEVCVVAVNMQ